MGCVWTNSGATNRFQFILLVERVVSSILFRIPLSFFSVAFLLPWIIFLCSLSSSRPPGVCGRYLKLTKIRHSSHGGDSDVDNTKNLRTLRPVWDLTALGVATGCRQQKPADPKTFRKSWWRQKGSWTRLGGRWSCEICFTVCSGFFVREFDNNKVWSTFVSCKFECLFSQCAFCIC